MPTPGEGAARDRLGTEDAVNFALRLFLDRPVLVGTPTDAVARFEADQMLDLLRRPENARLAGVLHYLVVRQRVGVSAAVASVLERMYGGCLAAFARQRAARLECLEALAARGIEVATIKGQELAGRIYEWPEVRVSRDIDLIVGSNDLDRAERVLNPLGWRRIQRLFVHDTYEKDGLVLEVHGRLFGRGDTILFGLSLGEGERFARGGFSAAEEYVLMALKLFCERRLDKARLLDLYLLRRSTPVEPEAVSRASDRWDAGYPLSVMERCLAWYDGRAARPPMAAGRARALWPHVKYAFLLPRISRPLRKIVAVAALGVPDARMAYPEGRPTTARHLGATLFVMLGLRERGLVNPRLRRLM